MTRIPLATLSYGGFDYSLSIIEASSRMERLPSGERYQSVTLAVSSGNRDLASYEQVPIFNQSFTLQHLRWDTFLVYALLQYQLDVFLPLGVESVKQGDLPGFAFMEGVNSPLSFEEKRLDDLAQALNEKSPHLTYRLKVGFNSGLNIPKIYPTLETFLFQPLQVRDIISQEELKEIAEVARQWLASKRSIFSYPIELNKPVTDEALSQLVWLSVSNCFQAEFNWFLSKESPEDVLSSLKPLAETHRLVYQALPDWFRKLVVHLLQGVPLEPALVLVSYQF